ncbi:MAG: class II aldolase/adducin family protein [Clostridiales Family XIII bacterium]|jgi:rhamnose utilization protein RhaD (predicted bifunctional aldolase and dehydrogenase)|nr:class II aldolase/adducin family protein [Clostridiales Family XIII bacterium]
MMDLSKLITMSRKYGEDEDYVLEGGGNTSCKEDGVMAVKASGGALGTIDTDGFVFMDVAKLRAMTGAEYPAADDEREALAIKDMMAARLAGQGDKRPSVECILHALFTERYVLHVHPALINGLTCSVEGAAAAAELFGDLEDSLLWIPLTKPGFILSKTCADAFEAHKAKYGAYPKVLLLQNHGIFIADDSTEKIDEIMADIVGRVRSRIKREPDVAESERKVFFIAKDIIPLAEDGVEGIAVNDGDPNGDTDSAADIAAALMSVYAEGGPAYTIFQNNAEIARLTSSKDAVAPLMNPFTPDHIVYDKAHPLWIPSGKAFLASGADASDIFAEFNKFVEANGFKPKVALVENLGAFTLGGTSHEAAAAAALLTDAVKIAVYTESYGGPLALPDDFTAFIANWEIESYRQKKSLG